MVCFVGMLLAIELTLRWDKPTGGVFLGNDCLAIELALRWDKPTGGVNPCPG